MMSEKQLVYMFWLAVKICDRTIEMGVGDKMLESFKRLKTKLGIKYVQQDKSDRMAEIVQILAKHLPMEEAATENDLDLIL